MSSLGFRKLYHSIREVSELTGQKPHVLRYWEQEFAGLKPKKNRAGNRVYTDRDVAVVRRIAALLKEEKYTIEGARQVLAREASGGASGGAGAGNSGVAPEVREDLVRLRAFLSDLLRRLGPGG